MEENMTKKEFAIKLHDQNYNCCQAVVCSFAEQLGADLETVFKAAEPFGLGMGDMNGRCGALSGALMTLGLARSDGNLDAPRSKAANYKIARQMKECFVSKTGAELCRDLKGVDTGVVLCTCPNCIRAGIETVCEVLGLEEE